MASAARVLEEEAECTGGVQGWTGRADVQFDAPVKAHRRLSIPGCGRHLPMVMLTVAYRCWQMCHADTSWQWKGNLEAVAQRDVQKLYILSTQIFPEPEAVLSHTQNPTHKSSIARAGGRVADCGGWWVTPGDSNHCLSSWNKTWQAEWRKRVFPPKTDTAGDVCGDVSLLRCSLPKLRVSNLPAPWNLWFCLDLRLCGWQW